MNFGASIIAVFSIWIIAVLAAIHYFMPSIEQSVAGIQAYEKTASDAELREAIGISEDTSYVSFTPLGIFDSLK